MGRNAAIGRTDKNKGQQQGRASKAFQKGEQSFTIFG